MTTCVALKSSELTTHSLDGPSSAFVPLQRRHCPDVAFREARDEFVHVTEAERALP